MDRGHARPGRSWETGRGLFEKDTLMSFRTWQGDVSGDLSVAGNWKEAAVPIAGDDLSFPPGGGDITAGFAALTGLAMASIDFKPGFAGAAGDDANDVKLTVATAGRFRFAGSGIAYIDLEASQVTPIIEDTAPADVGSHGLYIKGSALTGFVLKKGNVGLAARAGETTNVPAITVSQIDKPLGDCDLTIGAGVDASGSATPDLTVLGGIVTCYATLDALDVHELATFTQALGTWLTADIRGTVYPDAGGSGVTYATTRVHRNGRVENTRDGRAKTMTNLVLNAGSAFLDPDGLIARGSTSIPDGIESILQLQIGKDLTL